MYDYSLLPDRKICFVDLKSFYASVSCVKRGLDPRYTKFAVVGDVNRSGSIVLAATTPLKALGVKKMDRSWELPKRSDIIVVNPNMETYIKCSNYITSLALQYVAPEDFFQYSIDEFALELDSSLHLFASTPYEFAVNFQKEIYRKTRLESTIGLGQNILMSKLALDLDSKKSQSGIAEWRYEDIPTKLWPIRPLSKLWGISHKTEDKLNRKGIYTIGDLANYPLHYLKKSFSIMGEEYHLHSNGIDFSRISEKYVPATTSVGKSQILLRNYNIDEFLIILLEHIEEICYRLRRQNKLAQTIQFSVGYSAEYGGGIRKRHTMNRATNLTMDIYNICKYYLHALYTGEPIRSVSISLSNLLNEGEEQISLFDNIVQREKEVKLTKAMDEIRDRFGKKQYTKGNILYKRGYG